MIECQQIFISDSEQHQRWEELHNHISPANRLADTFYSKGKNGVKNFCTNKSLESLDWISQCVSLTLIVNL